MKEEQTLPDRNLADALIRAGRHAEAVALYRKLSEAFPEEDSHLLSLAWALHDSGRPEEAAGCFERLFTKELSRRLFTGFAYDELVRIYREGRNWEALISVCERASAAQPGDGGLLKTLGDAYLTADRAVDALRVYEALTTLEPETPEHWCALGTARLALGRIEEAQVAYRRAAEIDPAEAPLFFSRLAGAYLRAGWPEHAQAAIEQCLAWKPDDPHYLMDLGDILVHRGRPEAAADTYARAALVTPASAGACWCRLGEILAKKGLHAQATEAVEKAVAAEPENPRYMLRLAAAYAARGLTDLAEATLRRVEKLMPIN
ncbi:MAG: tetratricopeptide repeat protein [Syntrophales bacterium]